MPALNSFFTGNAENKEAKIHDHTNDRGKSRNKEMKSGLTDIFVSRLSYYDGVT